MKKISIVVSPKMSMSSNIYDKIENKRCIAYRYYSQNDTLQKRLDEFVKEYKEDSSISNKKKILEAEKQILLEELQNPELTLIRIKKDTGLEIKKKTKKIELFNWLRLCAINGLYRITYLPNIINSKLTNKDCEILKNAFSQISENNVFGFYAKALIIDILSLNDKVSLVQNLTKNKKLLDRISFREPDVDELFEKINKNKYTTEDLKKLLYLNIEDKNEKKLIKSLIIKLLNNEGISKEKKQVAVWGAGKFRSEKAYKIIKKIAKNKEEKDIILREYAIHSLAFYVKRHPLEVKKILSQIGKGNSIFSPLAKILKSKIDGTYLSVKNRPFYDRNMAQDDIEKFQKLKKELIDKKSVQLNIMQGNKLDDGLFAYLPALKYLISRGFKIGITDETATKFLKSVVGKRIALHVMDKNGGDFWDSCIGLSVNKQKPFIIIGLDSFTKKNSDVTKHELAHQLHLNVLSEDEYVKSFEIYEKSNKNKTPLGYYASTNEREYFACAMDAFLSPYRAHEELLSNTDSKYHLLVKDKKMYNFVNKMYEKYCKIHGSDNA